jgi:ubiquinone biosynthesis protein
MSIANMLIALSNEDYTRLAYEYAELAPFSDKLDVDVFARELSELIAPYYGLTLKDVNLGKILMASGSIAAKHHVKVPSELMLFFKSIVAIEGLGRKITPDFDFLQHALEYSVDIGKHQMDPQKITGELYGVLRESRNLIYGLPRQLNFLLRKINSPDHAIKLEVAEIQDLKITIEASFFLVFLSILIAALLISGALMAGMSAENKVYGLPSISFFCFLGGGILSGIALWHTRKFK